MEKANLNPTGSVDSIEWNNHASSSLRYVCPECRVGLNQKALPGGRELMCLQCGRKYEEIEGITDLRVSRKDYYFNPVPPQEMEELTDAMWEVGWPKTIQRFLRNVRNKKDWVDNLLSDGRYAWKLFLPLNPETVLLDLGCGLGNLTVNLAPHVQHTYAMDLTFARLQFAKRRIQHLPIREKVSFLAGGDGQHLPFPDQSLDGVILSGVLEWVGEGELSWEQSPNKIFKALNMMMSNCGGTSPRSIQCHFLRDIVRVLKPTGFVFIGIENRLNYEYFLGRPDHHSGLLFGSLLPRVLATAYSIIKTYKPYRTYTYSINGYKRLLKYADISHLKFLGLSPGYSNLRTIIPLEGKWKGWQVKGESIREKIKIHKKFVPAYGILASNHDFVDSSDLLSGILRQVESQIFGTVTEKKITLSSMHLTDKNKGIAFGQAENFPIVLKFPFSRFGENGEIRNWEFLKFVEKKKFFDVMKCSRTLAIGQENKQRFFVEHRVPGTLLHYSNKEMLPRYYLGVYELLLSWENAIPSCQAPLVGAKYDEQVTQHLSNLESFFQLESLFESISDYFKKNLMGVDFHCGLRHGDLSVSNIFVGEGGISGLIDWENYELEGLSFFNALDFLWSVSRRIKGTVGIAATLREVTLGVYSCEEEQWFFEQACRQWEISSTMIRPFIYLYGLQHVNGQLEHGMKFDENWIAKETIPLLELIAEG